MDAAPSNDQIPARSNFCTTHWSVVLAAGSTSAESTAALETLCRTYWQPLYAFVRREGHTVEEAQDLTQAFFARILERRDLATVRQHKGRFRSYLLAALRNFLTNEWHRGQAIKRGGGQVLIPLDRLLEEERLAAQATHGTTAEMLFERRWALALLETVLARLEAEFAGDVRVFQSWKRHLNEDMTESLAAAATELGTNQNALKQAFHRLRGRYRQLLREEVAQTVAQPGEIEDELKHLVRVLRS